MEQTRKEIGETRAHTDASLSAERASTDTASDRALARSQRVLDDLLERDRIVADEQLSKFRDSADLVLLHEREVSPARDSAVAVERKLADEGRQAERDATDALLEGERRRADENMDAEREERVKHRVRHGVRRQATDQQLTNERSGADEAESVHDETKHALQRAQADQARNRDVLAMVTHDLRSPLSVIAMNAQHIATITKEDSTREAADDMMRSAARMARLLADLLDVARIESNTLRIVEREHDVGTLLGEVSRTYQPLFAARTMTFVLQQPATPIVASFDHDRIVQVLSNLLGNAMKFNAPRATVLLRVERRADEIEFVLTDTGPGIHPSALPHVFERFCQIDEESRRGLGLGLYICEKIVAAHGGRISAESELGKGATFRFTLPLR